MQPLLSVCYTNRADSHYAPNCPTEEEFSGCDKEVRKSYKTARCVVISSDSRRQ